MRKAFLLIVILLMTLSASAVPAMRRWFTFVQPDGKQVRLLLVGDENLHYYLTSDSVPVVDDGEAWCYARLHGNRLLSTGVVAHEPGERGSEEWAAMTTAREIEGLRRVRGVKSKGATKAKRRQSSSLDVFKGKKKGLVILANFSNKQFYDYSPEDQGAATRQRYEAQLNELGYRNEKHDVVGSVRDYFLAQSDGLFDLSFDVVGPVNLENDVTHYGRNVGNEDAMAHVMVKECCEAVADMVDFADYDWDGDGEVEEVFVLYAGYGEATGGGSRTIWPHMWTITEATKPGDDAPEAFTVDGLRVDVYACSNELYGSRGTTEMGIGCFCHEFSHCLGLPDLYDTENSYTYVMGAWDLLDSGCYNGPDGLGWVPAGFNSYEKQFVGWYDIKELMTDTIVDRMLPLNEGGEAYAIYNDAYADEYYVMENRQRTGWDKYLPGEGLLFIHVDYDEQLWEDNLLNTVGESNDHLRFALIRASNGRSREKDAYPNGDNQELTDTSVPAATLFHENTDGTKLMHKPVTDITRDEQTGVVSFVFRNENDPDGLRPVMAGEGQTTVFRADGMPVAVPSSGIGALPRGLYLFRLPDGRVRKVLSR